MATANTNTSANKNVDQLNSFLRGEISAVEAYRIALEKLSPESPHASVLTQVMESHQRRADKLQSRIRQLGGEPSRDSGAWGAFTGAVENTAAAMGDNQSIAALESGEDHGLADYRRDIGSLSPELRGLVNAELLPAQEETHQKLSFLKKTLDH